MEYERAWLRGYAENQLDEWFKEAERLERELANVEAMIEYWKQEVDSYGG